MLWWMVTLLGSASNMIAFVLLISWYISKSSFNVKYYASVTSSSFMPQALSSFMSSPSLSSSFGISGLLNCTSVNISTVSYFFCNSIYAQFKFHFQQYHLLFLCCALIFVGQFPLLIIHFCKTSHEFITGRQGGNTTTHFASCASTQ